MKSPCFQFYPGDFIMGTCAFSAEERGAYMVLLCFQWTNGGLPNDDEQLAKMAGCHGNAVAKVKSKFSLCADGMIRNARLETERTKQEKYREKQVRNANRRWGKNATALPPHSQASTKTDAKPMPSAMPNACLSSSSKEEETTPTKTPSLEEVLEYAKSPQGNVSAEDAEIWWNQQEKRGHHPSGHYQDHQGNPVVKWQNDLRSYGLRMNGKRRELKSKGPMRNHTFTPVEPLRGVALHTKATLPADIDITKGWEEGE